MEFDSSLWPLFRTSTFSLLNWFKNHQISENDNWLFMGDFNFYRSLQNRNRSGGNLNDTFLFNEAIGHLGLIELPIKGRAYTWSNMQQNPLLEQLDWFFTSVNWTTTYPMTEVLPLAKVTSDHVPCKVSMGSTIPKTKIFRFENYWTEHSDFMNVVIDSWSQSLHYSNSPSYLAAKFKRLRQALKKWSKDLSNLKLLISNCNMVILFLDTLEEQRQLFNTEENLRNVIKGQMTKLLHCKKVYWKNRYTVNKIKLGDECTKFFHSMATIAFRRNSIPHLLNTDGAVVTDHCGKADLIWSTFKNRMGVTSSPTMLFNLQELISPDEQLDCIA